MFHSCGTWPPPEQCGRGYNDASFLEAIAPLPDRRASYRVSSLFKIFSAIMSLNAVFGHPSPLGGLNASVKKYFISNSPLGVCMYLAETGAC